VGSLCVGYLVDGRVPGRIEAELIDQFVDVVAHRADTVGQNVRKPQFQEPPSVHDFSPSTTIACSRTAVRQYELLGCARDRVHGPRLFARTGRNLLDLSTRSLVWTCRFRRCIRELRAVDGEYYALIDGRHVVSGERRHVEGYVIDTRLEPSKEVASITIETDEGEVAVGGRVAALEDIEAHEIEIRHDPPTGR